jgi:poly(A) polymerase
MRTARLKRWMASPTFPDELALHRVDCLGSNGFTDNYEFVLAKQAEFASAPVLPPRLLNGHDLMALGYPPGPALGDILNAVQDAQLEGAVETREDAVSWLKKHFPPEK